ncbi:MAG: hypothetical protein ACYTG6_14040 [Planctomycetota bacterium]|jgi:hypothetical protein
MLRPIPSDSPTPKPRPAERGLGLIEVLIAAAVAALALMAHLGTTLHGHRLSRAQESRSVALETLHQFIERTRADDDWAGLYGRLQSKLAAGASGYPLTAYYSDFPVPGELSQAEVLVEVPQALPVDAEAGETTMVLREDVSHPALGLPFDLNGDGVIDGEARNADYRALPATFTLRWYSVGGMQQEMRVTTWLKGER